MSEIDRAVANNMGSIPSMHANDGPRPRRHLAILTCMDTRLNPYKTMRLVAGEAHILRNSGAIVTEDVLRSLVLSHRALGTRELMIIGHTDCGLCGLDEWAFRAKLVKESGENAPIPAQFHTFVDLDALVLTQVERVRTHPWLRDLTTRGFVYHVENGKLREVTTPPLLTGEVPPQRRG